MARAEGDPQITPIACFGDCDPLSMLVINLVAVATLVLGALLMQRWRDLPFVAFVTLLSAAIANHARDIAIAGRPLSLDAFGYTEPATVWRAIGIYLMLLMIAFAVHAGKRAVMWWFSGGRVVPDG